MTSQIIYTGNLRTEAKHLQSGTVIETDAPVDNQGKGERFSPTDLVATALGSCILTTMGIKARDMNIDLVGTTMDVTKVMVADPRRIGTIKVILNFPPALALSEKDKTILERTAHACPVAQSLNASLIQEIVFNWNN